MAMARNTGAYAAKAGETRARTVASGSGLRPIPAQTLAARLRASRVPPGGPSPSAVSYSTLGVRPSRVPVGDGRGPRTGPIRYELGMNSIRGRETGGGAGTMPRMAHSQRAGSAHIVVQHMCAECGVEDQKRVQAKRAPTLVAVSTDALRETPQVLDVVRNGGGQPLSSAVRADMEARLGADFSDVRVHTSPEAAASARSLNAVAYTVGEEIVLSDDSAAAHTTEARTRLAHELTHVLQQRMGPVSGTDMGHGFAVSSPDDHFERYAEEAARRAVSGGVRNRAGRALQQAPMHCHVPSSIQRLVIQRDGPQNDPDWQAGYQDGINGAASDSSSRSGDPLQSYNDGYAKGSYDSAQQGGQTYTPTPAPQPGEGGSSVALQQDKQAYQAGYDDGVNNRPYDYNDQAKVLGLGYEQDYQNGYNQGQAQWQAQHSSDEYQGPAVGPAVQEPSEGHEPDEEREFFDEESATTRIEAGRYTFLKNIIRQAQNKVTLGLSPEKAWSDSGLNDSDLEDYRRLFEIFGPSDGDPVPIPPSLSLGEEEYVPPLPEEEEAE